MPVFSSDNQPTNRGRKKGSLNTKTILNNFLSGKITGLNGRRAKRLMHIIEKQYQLAELGSTKAFNALMDRAEGKPQQTVEVKDHKTLVVETAGERPKPGSIVHKVGTDPDEPKALPPAEESP